MSTENPTDNTTILLVDNGSTRVDAAVQLRKLAQQLSDKTGKTIHAVSLKHSDRIPLDDVENKLSGIPARVFTEFMAEQLRAGKREFILIPLFFGRSRALTIFVPDETAKLETEYGSFKLIMTEVLYPLPEGDSQFIDILYEHAITAVEGNSRATLSNLVLVDHGTPLPAVNAVRQHIASAVNARMPNGISIDQAAMERREGKEYDFNGVLLEDYLKRLAKAGETQARVLLLFLLAGTHAGENGDIVQICDRVMTQYPNFNVSISPLISQNGKLIDCLEQRLAGLPKQT